MWVAIDCRSKNWVAALKRFGSTATEPLKMWQGSHILGTAVTNQNLIRD
jgi:hypothetical protein